MRTDKLKLPHHYSFSLRTSWMKYMNAGYRKSGNFWLKHSEMFLLESWYENAISAVNPTASIFGADMLPISGSFYTLKLEEKYSEYRWHLLSKYVALYPRKMLSSCWSQLETIIKQMFPSLAYRFQGFDWTLQWQWWEWKPSRLKYNICPSNALYSKGFNLQCLYINTTCSHPLGSSSGTH
jgi:hypothetical protein